MSAPFCPHCGHNIEADKAMELADWTLWPHETTYRAQRLALTTQESAFLHTLALAKGRTVQSDVAGARISDAEDPRNLAAVMALRLRRKLPELIGIVPFETVHNQGYRWAV